MNFSSLSLNLSVVASKLMGLSAPSQNSLLADGTDVISGDNGFFETLFQIIISSFGDLFTYFLDLIVRLFYAIGHWVLVIIDFIFVFVRQFIGMNTDFTTVEGLTEGDIVFQFIFSESVLKIIRNLLIFGIVLLIIFSIFAIIKSEYEFMTQNSDNSKKKIFANALKSLFLMIFVPVVAIGSIIMSNAILKSLYLATSGGNDSMSMGTQIFLASTYDANAYRRYANNDMKIPITFNFSSVSSSDVTKGYYTDGTVAEAESALREFKSQDVWTRGFKTYLMFASDAFLNMSDIDALDRAYQNHGEISPYHEVYDTGIYSQKEQYLIMADVIEYAMKKNRTIYFKTIEECFKSFEKVKGYLNGQTNPISMKSAEEFAVTVNYESEQGLTQFVHKTGAIDEANGAVFVVALEKKIVLNKGKKDEKILTYYSPIQNGFDDFATDYYSSVGNVVIAKGLFEEGENPTAIKENDGVVEFYRDDLNIPMLTDIFPKISYELPEGTTEHLGTKILKGAVKALTGVDLSQFIPYVYFSVDLFHMFTKQSNVIVDLEGGAFKLNYNFTSRDFDKTNVYKMSEFNIVIFTLASVILGLMLFKLLVGIIFRVLELTTLAITYPAVLATIPLDDGSRFKSWVNEFAKRLLSVYGVIVAMNLVLMLAPVAERIDVFTKADIETAVALGQLRVGLSADFMNELTHFLFVLVAMASIEPFIAILDQAVQDLKDKPKNDKGSVSPILQDGDKVVKDLKSSAVFIGQVTSGEIFVTAGKEVLNTAVQFAMPGVQVLAQEAKSIQDSVDKARSMVQSVQDKASVFKNAKLAMQQKSSNDSGSSETPGGTTPSGDSPETTSSGGGAPSSSAPETGEAGGSDSGTSDTGSADGEAGGTISSDESSSGSGLEDESMGEADVHAESSPRVGETPTESDTSDDTSEATETGDADSLSEAGTGSDLDTGLDDGESGDGGLSSDDGSGSESGSTSDDDDYDDEETTTDGSAGRRIGRAAGGVALGTIATSAKLTGKLALISGKLVLGLTKTALKMVGLIIKASHKNLVNLAEQTEKAEGDPSKIDYAGSLGKFALTGAKAFRVGASGIVKEGSKFVGRATKVSAKTTTQYLGNVFNTVKKELKSSDSSEDSQTNSSQKQNTTTASNEKKSSSNSGSTKETKTSTSSSGTKAKKSSTSSGAKTKKTSSSKTNGGKSTSSKKPSNTSKEKKTDGSALKSNEAKSSGEKSNKTTTSSKEEKLKKESLNGRKGKNSPFSKEKRRPKKSIKTKSKKNSKK